MIRSLFAEWRDGFLALAPSRFPYGRFALAMMLSFCGALVFNHFQLPLAWMLGAMTFCLLATLVRLPVAAPTTVRPPVIALIGVLLGSGFTPQVITSIPGWLPTLLGLFAFILVSGLVCIFYLHKIGGFDLQTSYFAGMPGGLAEMIVLGDEKGADTRVIAMVQSARVFTIVMVVPFLVQWLSGTDIANRGTSTRLSIFDADWTVLLWLLGTAFAGSLLGHMLRLPSKYLLGTMIASVVVHATGLTNFSLPYEIVSVAQLVMGAIVGCRFAGTPPRDILRVLGLSLGATAMLLVITICFAEGMSMVSSYGGIPLILAYSPAGIAEMSLIAIVLQIEVAFVATHHIVRIFAVMLGARLLFRWVEGRQKTS